MLPLRAVQKSDTLTAYGIVNLSVCNMRATADFTAEMTTQGLLGMPVRVLQYKEWYQIELPDGYIGWVHRVAISPVTSEQLHRWNSAEKIIVTAHYGFVYSEPDEDSQPVSDVVAGNRLKWEGRKGRFYRVSYPDGRIGYLHRDLAMPEPKWRKELKQDAASIIRTAHTLLGVPYLWAGTSSKGMDCSGFIRNILYMHDIIIPRDAGPQSRTGERITIAPDYGNLQPGDLIFFGRKAVGADKKERVEHVGMYIGNKRFIHSQGDVRISSFDPDDPLFDRPNLNRLLFAGRILPYINKEKELNTTETNPFYRL
ncbi:MAG: C40 family peptidase [Prevotellaceae bacterium]|jgi:SH3-like domain-containing protein|nr:C40 family peptidase [Prevotellaceae bacterium]